MSEHHQMLRDVTEWITTERPILTRGDAFVTADRFAQYVLALLDELQKERGLKMDALLELANVKRDHMADVRALNAKLKQSEQETGAALDAWKQAQT